MKTNILPSFIASRVTGRQIFSVVRGILVFQYITSNLRYLHCPLYFLSLNQHNFVPILCLFVHVLNWKMHYEHVINQDVLYNQICTNSLIVFFFFFRNDVSNIVRNGVCFDN